jgi:hypothetical protein
MLQGIISCLHLLNHILHIKIDALVRTRPHIIPSEGWGFTRLIVNKKKRFQLINTSLCIYNPYSLAYTGVAFQVWWKLN